MNNNPMKPNQSNKQIIEHRHQQMTKRRYYLAITRLILLIILIALVLYLLFLGGKIIYKKIFSSNNHPNDTISNPDSPNNENEKYPPELKEKLEKMNYINEKINYFKIDKIDRYLAYKEKNPNLTDQQIVTYVNIGLDQPYYTNTYENENVNSITVLVNKYYSLPATYIPFDLEKLSSPYSSRSIELKKEAKEAFEQLVDAAKKDGYTVQAMSSYRSYKYQQNLYNNYVKSDGISKADTYSARPGFSEHQTGLTVDVWDTRISYTSFKESKSYIWMQNNAHKYGFIERYPEDKENITGYSYEAWHYRYVGKEVATYIHDHQITFDEYYMMFIDYEEKN